MTTLSTKGDSLFRQYPIQRRMTVRDLKEILSDSRLSDDTEIILSSDPEGDELYYPWKNSFEINEDTNSLILFPEDKVNETPFGPDQL
jgi:hypothetical protein